MVEGFAAKPGETARAHVSSLSGSHPTLFPAARFDRIANLPRPGRRSLLAESHVADDASALTDSGDEQQGGCEGAD
jgi:hypothetical protein